MKGTPRSSESEAEQAAADFSQKTHEFNPLVSHHPSVGRLRSVAKRRVNPDLFHLKEYS